MRMPLERLFTDCYCGHMLTCDRLEQLPALGQPLHLAVGVFDGLHLGHQAVIAKAVLGAQREGGLAGLLTFDPHPIQIIAPDKAPASLLETLDHKARVVKALGVNLFVPLRFDEALASMEPGEFLDRLCIAPVRTMAVGEDWRFGHNRSGDIRFLRDEAVRRGFHLEAVPPVMIDGDRISSTRIRQAIRDGNLDAAARMLGRPYSVVGEVEPGDQLGRQLGFPTINLRCGRAQLPPDGVWAVHVSSAEGDLWQGAANLGVRPTLGGGTRRLEVHLLDFSGNLYGRMLEVEFVRHVRGEAKFPSLEALQRQIHLDIHAVRTILAGQSKA